MSAPRIEAPRWPEAEPLEGSHPANRPLHGAHGDTHGDRDAREFWDEQLPAYLAEAVDALGPRFDALIVDEAQDFDEAWWLPLQMLLRDPDHGIVYV
jgi:hypothetical protein